LAGLGNGLWGHNFSTEERCGVIALSVVVAQGKNWSHLNGSTDRIRERFRGLGILGERKTLLIVGTQRSILFLPQVLSEF